MVKNLWLFEKNRLLILHALYKCLENGQCGCELIEKLEIPKNLLSYHVKKLREEGFIDEVKCGKKKEYTLSARKRDFVEKILKIVELI
ncbi:ArsR family transcriptional regulator [Candidatus Dojkabacteria bacterium]|nr:ArsR family transcriptional regulator [Candidatus Dojkabacteria bacterium]